MAGMLDSKAALSQLVELIGRSQPDWRAFRGQGRRALLVTFVNPHSVRMMMDRPGYAADLAAFDITFPDGNLLALSASRQLRRVVDRRSFDGNSLALEVFEFCRLNSLKIALIGGVDGVAASAAAVFAREFAVDIAYVRSGYFNGDEEVHQCHSDIEAQSIDVVICGMGAPYQDRFLLGLKTSGWSGLGFTCGGYLDQALTGIKYYPEWVNRLNLRAPYRLLREPRRLWRRYLIEYLPFMVADARLRMSGGGSSRERLP